MVGAMVTDVSARRDGVEKAIPPGTTPDAFTLTAGTQSFEAEAAPQTSSSAECSNWKALPTMEEHRIENHSSERTSGP